MFINRPIILLSSKYLALCLIKVMFFFENILDKNVESSFANDVPQYFNSFIKFKVSFF